MIYRSFLCVVLALVCAGSAFAYPMFLEEFRKDAFRQPNLDGCAVCHVNPQGGGDRNVFGQAFERGGERITPMLRSQFPDRFVYPISRDGAVVIHFADPENKQIVVETGGNRALVDVASRTLNGTPASSAATPAAATAVSTIPSRNEAPVVRVDPLSREGAFFGSQIVNLPNGKPVRAGGVDFLIGHRFRSPISWSQQGLGELFGFDGSATIDFGVRVGLTNHISVAVARSNLDRTIELSSTLNVVRQGGKSPFTFAIRAGVEGQNNFRVRHSSFFQPILVHTIADRVSFELAPTFAFNTRDEDTFLPPEFVFGANHNNTVGLGIGTGIRLLRTTSLVGEYIPRVHGFRGQIKDRPGVSIGLQKSTFRHTFELVVARQEPMTTAQYAVQGTDAFHIGFNIYRRIR